MRSSGFPGASWAPRGPGDRDCGRALAAPALPASPTRLGPALRSLLCFEWALGRAPDPRPRFEPPGRLSRPTWIHPEEVHTLEALLFVGAGGCCRASRVSGGAARRGATFDVAASGKRPPESTAPPNATYRDPPHRHPPYGNRDGPLGPEPRPGASARADPGTPEITCCTARPGPGAAHEDGSHRPPRRDPFGAVAPQSRSAGTGGGSCTLIERPCVPGLGSPPWRVCARSPTITRSGPGILARRQSAPPLPSWVARPRDPNRVLPLWLLKEPRPLPHQDGRPYLGGPARGGIGTRAHGVSTGGTVRLSRGTILSPVIPRGRVFGSIATSGMPSRWYLHRYSTESEKSAALATIFSPAPIPAPNSKFGSMYLLKGNDSMPGWLSHHRSRPGLRWSCT